MAVEMKAGKDIGIAVTAFTVSFDISSFLYESP